jgi:hypothetical protein
MRAHEFLLEELTFKGYPCTIDCSGHRAGYDYATRWGLDSNECPYGASNSFWEGCKSRGEEDLEEDLDEMAGEVHRGIANVLADKGYQYLGSGIDKHAYMEPKTGQVLLIFGYRKGVEGFSPDQRMFIDWINYCNKNKNNPHLPRFSGFESFQFQGKNYIQARMEALQELPEEVGYLVGNIEEVTMQVGRGNFDRAIETLAGYAQDSSYEGDAAVWYDIKTAIRLLGGKKQAKNLLDTVHTVKKFGRKHGFSIDLHRGNYMQRHNGTIVVNDPFVLWLRS